MDEDEALALALEVLQQRVSARRASAPSVRALFEKYEAVQRHRKNWKAAEVKLRPFVTAFGDRDASSLTVAEWTEHAAKRLITPVPNARGRKGVCYGVGTVNVELKAAKACLNWGVTQGLLRFNPLAAAKRLKFRKSRDTAPNERELGLFLAACRRPEHVVMVLAAGDVGLRTSEIRALQHDWLDEDKKTLTLPNHACKNGRGGTVPVTGRFLEAVAALPRHIRWPYVLWSERSRGAYSRYTLNAWWVEIRERAGVPAAPGDGAVHLHDCRASAATNALDRGVRLETVSRRILRHASIATTELYLRSRETGDLTEAIEAMEAGIIRDQKRR